jgi:hypothetical protein
LIGLGLSAIPFIRRALKQDQALMIAALVFIIVRALAFAIGVVGGTVGMFFFRPALAHKNEV